MMRFWLMVAMLSASPVAPSVAQDNPNSPRGRQLQQLAPLLQQMTPGQVVTIVEPEKWGTLSKPFGPPKWGTLGADGWTGVTGPAYGQAPR